MDHLRALMPVTALGKARLAAVAYACLGVAPQLFQMSPDHAAGRRLLGAAAMCLLLADLVVTYLRHRPLPLEPLLVAPMVLLSGSYLRDPVATVGLCFSVLVTQSLYGSHRAATARIVAVMAAFPATLAVPDLARAPHLLALGHGPGPAPGDSDDGGACHGYWLTVRR